MERVCMKMLVRGTLIFETPLNVKLMKDTFVDLVSGLLGKRSRPFCIC